ncbi:MAG: transglutaminase family protein [Caulobacterales bacterium]
MTRLQIRHETTYEYAQPVVSGPWRLMMRPLDTHASRLVDANFIFTPPGATEWTYDVYGNSVCFYTPDGASQRIGVVNNLVIDRFPAALAAQRYDPRSTLPLSYSDSDRIVLQPFLTPATNDAERSFMQWIVSQTGAPGGLALHAVQRLNQTIHAQFDYGERNEVGVQSPTETLKRGAGTCRDFAWLMIETLRRLGFAARFVTGYLYSPGNAGIRGAGATHAWCEVYFPDLGWLEFDPTNGLAESSDLIRIAATRTPEEASPMNGMVQGGAIGQLHVSVSVDLIG